MKSSQRCADPGLDGFRGWSDRRDAMTNSPRIISLLPSATEIVAALGFGDHLVGRSHECDFPPGVEKLPPCSSTKVPLHGTSYEIDQRVKEIVAEGLSVYRVQFDRPRRPQPDLILTPTQSTGSP